jgi:hypothetical protein
MRGTIICLLGAAGLTALAVGPAVATHERMALGAKAPPNSTALFTYCRRLTFHKYKRGMMTRRNRDRIAGLCMENGGKLYP